MVWILTQNRHSFINVKDISVKGRSIVGFIENNFMDQWTKIIGKYESDGRALEVLNEIFIKVESSNGFNVTFTMPES